MPNPQELLNLKEQIKTAIRRNSDQGFVPYGGCNRVCAEIQAVIKIGENHTKAGDYQQAFDIYIMVLLETVRLVSHADDSSGDCGDIIHSCLIELDTICKIMAGNGDKYFFDTLTKTVKNKAFNGWAEWAYQLLKSAVYFVDTEKEARKIQDLFPILGKMYNEQDYPDKYLIILGIIERLYGKEAARKYLFDNLAIDELREIAVEEAIAEKEFIRAEKLCREALTKNDQGYYSRPSEWAYLLERIYEMTNNNEALTAIRQEILFLGDSAYFRKLKAIYESQGVWEREQLPLWRELSTRIHPHNYISLLSQEGELSLLLEAIKQHQSFISDYGKQLSAQYPNEVYQIYNNYILNEAVQANDRGKYRRICSLLKSFAGTGAKKQSLELINHLCELYPRRPAMLEELVGLRQELDT